MKKLFIYLFLFCTTASVFAAKQSGKIGPNATWNYDSSSKEFRISGTGVTYDGSYSYNGMYQAAPKKRNARMDSPNGAITFKYGAQLNGDAYTFNPDDVISIVVDEGITKLGEWTCAFFHNAKSVSLPKSLTNLCGGAFLDNTSLSNVTIPVNVDTMNVAICKSANSIYGDDINYGAFHGCTKLKTVYWNVRGNSDGTIAQPLEGLEDILTKIVFGETVVHIPEKMCVYFKKISGELRIEKNIKTIGYAAFGECTGINKITLVADSLETVPTLFMNSTTFASQYYNHYGAPFAKCSKNLEIFIGKNVQYIGDFMFSDYERVGIMIAGYTTYRIDNNDYIDSLHITIEEGSNLKHIGDYAFAGAKGLMNFTLPDSIEEIMPYAFCGTDLKKIVIPESMSRIAPYAFDKCKLDTVWFNAQMCGSSSIADLYTEIRTIASPFTNGSDTTVFVIGEKASSIPAFFFSKYEYKESLNWVSPAFSPYFTKKPNNHYKIQFAPNSTISEIGACAFAGNMELEELIIPNKCRSIGTSAFENCENIGYVQMRNPQAKEYAIEFGENIFSGCNKIQKVDWNIATSHFKSMQQTPFYNCAEKIESFTFGDIVWRIPNFLCANMTALKAMNLPKSVSNVGDSAFFNCIGIDTFYVHPTYPPRLGKEAFPTDANIKVKCVAKDEYLNDTVWNKNNITSECLLSYFTVRFLITDGTVLQEELVREGDIPVYKGETPQRAEDQYYTYTFKGWSPELAPVKYNTNYYAVFESHWKDNDEDEGINDVKSENSSNKILYNGRIYILRGNNIYTITGQKINIDK